jgi:hypothetical protein
MGSLPNNGAALAAMVAAIALVIYFASVLLGALLAVFSGYLEIATLDRIQIKRSTRDEYWSQWYRCVEHLEQQSSENSYLSGLADLFLFQIRCFVALLLLSCLAAALAQLSGWPNSLASCLVGFLLSGALLFYSSYRYHNQLASMRRRRFANPPRVLAEAEELLDGMLLRWCERKSLEPLAVVLPIWPPKKTKADLTATAKALEDVLALPGTTVYASERDTLKSVKRLIEDEAARAP